MIVKNLSCQKILVKIYKFVNGVSYKYLKLLVGWAPGARVNGDDGGDQVRRPRRRRWLRN
jgi:hypothetical protein